MKAIDKFYLDTIVFKPDERTDSAIRELCEFILRWHRRIGLPSRSKKDLQKLRKYVSNKNADEDVNGEFSA